MSAAPGSMSKLSIYFFRRTPSNTFTFSFEANQCWYSAPTTVKSPSEVITTNQLKNRDMNLIWKSQNDLERKKLNVSAGENYALYQATIDWIWATRVYNKRAPSSKHKMDKDEDKPSHIVNADDAVSSALYPIKTGFTRQLSFGLFAAPMK